MTHLFAAGKLLLHDLAATICFLVVFLATHNVPLAVALGIALGVGQIAWQLARKAPIDSMEWLSLLLVVGSGAATLYTADARFVMLKPSLIYTIVGVVMLKRGWINRYLPPIAKAVVPDVAEIMGYCWAGLMFASAAFNVLVLLNFSVATWAWVMPLYGLVSKLVLFLSGFAAMRIMARRRLRAMPAAERERFLAQPVSAAGFVR